MAGQYRHQYGTYVAFQHHSSNLAVNSPTPTAAWSAAFSYAEPLTNKSIVSDLHTEDAKQDMLSVHQCPQQILVYRATPDRYPYSRRVLTLQFSPTCKGGKATATWFTRPSVPTSVVGYRALSYAPHIQYNTNAHALFLQNNVHLRRDDALPKPPPVHQRQPHATTPFMLSETPM